MAGLPASAEHTRPEKLQAQDRRTSCRKLRAAGAIVLGKRPACMSWPLAFRATTPRFQSGPPDGVRNADVKNLAGPPRTGNGAAIGSRIAMIGLGTDTGGSVRIPCALNGCVSVCLTVGRYSQRGDYPTPTDTRWAHGCFGIRRSAAGPHHSGGNAIQPAALGKVRVGVAQRSCQPGCRHPAFDAALAK